MLKTTRWKPDTCGCVIDYQWDTEVPAESRTHTPVATVPCPAHAALPDIAAKYVAVVAENGRKNQFLGAALESISQLRDSIDGSFVLKQAISFRWSWDVNRVLHVSFSGITLTAQQRSTLQTLANNRFGVGNVVVD